VGQASEPPGPGGKASPAPPPRPLHPSPRRLTRHGEVVRALEDPQLVPPGGDRNGDGGGERAREVGRPGGIREPFRTLLSPARMLRLIPIMEADAMVRVSALPEGIPVDLVEDYAVPWSLGVAGQVTGVGTESARRCSALAREIFLSAAHSRDGAPGEAACTAAAELAGRLRGDDGAAEPGGDTAARVQAFVALTCTLPALLGGSWHALLAQDDPRQVHPWRGAAGGSLTPGVVEELLRLGGPARVLFREEGPGDGGPPLELDLTAANRDPDAFPSPLDLDPRRPGGRHLAMGRGAHACAGASLVRTALRVATEALLRHGHHMEPAAPPEWLEGFTIRAPRTLPVVLRRHPPVDVSRPGAP